MSTSELIIEQLQIGPMQNFVYIVGSRATREVVIVDPAWDIDALSAHLAENDYTLKGALVTHYHPDHIGGGFGGRKIAGLAELLAKHPGKDLRTSRRKRWRTQGHRRFGERSGEGRFGRSFECRRHRGRVSAHARSYARLTVFPHPQHAGIGRHVVHPRVRPGRSARFRSGADVSQPAQTRRAARRHVVVARPSLQRSAERDDGRNKTAERRICGSKTSGPGSR